jgi:hypothetical protein
VGHCSEDEGDKFGIVVWRLEVGQEEGGVIDTAERIYGEARGRQRGDKGKIECREFEGANRSNKIESA